MKQSPVKSGKRKSRPAGRILRLTAALLLIVLLPCCAGAEQHFALRARGCGPLKYLTGDVQIIVAFVSTPQHPWTEKKKNEVFRVSNSSVRIMNQQARRYKADLNLSYCYMEFSIPVECDSERNWYNYILKNVFYRDSMPQVLDYYNQDRKRSSTPIIFMFNSWDRSYAMVSSTDYPGWNEEYCVIFCDTKMHDNYLTHEVLHLYGAIDLYDYNGEGVERVAKKYFRNSDMLTVSHNVDDLTAYLVGWTDSLSSKARKFLAETEGMR